MAEIPEPQPRVSQAPPPTPAEADAAFVRSLRGAGLLEDLTDTLLQVFMERLGATDHEDARHLDLLELYYQAGGDGELARRRVVQDRFFVYHDDEPTTAHDIVRRMMALHPELPQVQLERIGNADTHDGPLVLRAGEHLSAIDDQEQEDLDTGEVDLAALDEDDVATIALRSLVCALNGLLERHNLRRRLVMLRADGGREAFIATGPTEAVALCKSGCLETDDPQRLFEFAAW